MRERTLTRAYGRELFREFTPSVVRPVADAADVDLVSSELFADCAGAIAGAVVELSYPGPLLLEPVLRAVRHADALLVIALPEPAPGGVEVRRTVQEALEVAARVAHDRPLALVTRAATLETVDDGELDRFVERVYAVLDTGITGVSFRPADIAVDAAIRLTRAVRPLLELGIGVEVEVDGPQGSLVLAELDEIGLPLAAVRGATEDDELCGGVLVVDPLTDALPEGDVGLRVVVDGFVLRAALEALGPAEKSALLDVASAGVGTALRGQATLFDELQRGERDRLEALVYGNVTAALRRLGARGAASRLLDALAADYYGTGASEPT